jgi:hypothetical protein
MSIALNSVVVVAVAGKRSKDEHQHQMNAAERVERKRLIKTKKWTGEE